MSRLVNYVKLHGGDAFLPGVGGLGSTLPPSGKAFGMVMTLGDTGLTIKLNGIEAFIPAANIQIAVFSPEEKAPAKSKS